MPYINNKKKKCPSLAIIFYIKKVHIGVIRFSERTFDTLEKALEPAKIIGQIRS